MYMTTTAGGVIYVRPSFQRGGLLVWRNGNEKLSTGQFNIRPADGVAHYCVGSVVTCDTLSMAMLALMMIEKNY